jgi:hypothetical protein
MVLLCQQICEKKIKNNKKNSVEKNIGDIKDSKKYD